jgi:hypothetical protein
MYRPLSLGCSLTHTLQKPQHHAPLQRARTLTRYQHHPRCQPLETRRRRTDRTSQTTTSRASSARHALARRLLRSHAQSRFRSRRAHTRSHTQHSTRSFEQHIVTGCCDSAPRDEYLVTLRACLRAHRTHAGMQSPVTAHVASFSTHTETTTQTQSYRQSQARSVSHRIRLGHLQTDIALTPTLDLTSTHLSIVSAQPSHLQLSELCARGLVRHPAVHGAACAHRDLSHSTPRSQSQHNAQHTCLPVGEVVSCGRADIEQTDPIALNQRCTCETRHNQNNVRTGCISLVGVSNVSSNRDRDACQLTRTHQHTHTLARYISTSPRHACLLLSDSVTLGSGVTGAPSTTNPSSSC